jgi:hypothetical protein
MLLSLRRCEKIEIGVSAPRAFSYLEMKKSDFSDFFTPSQEQSGREQGIGHRQRAVSGRQ